MKNAILLWLDRDKANKSEYKSRIGKATAQRINDIYVSAEPNDDIDEIYFKLWEHGYLLINC